MSLLEALVALGLSLLLVVGLWRGTAAANRHATWVDRQSSRVDAARVVGLLLDLDAPGLVGPGTAGEVAVRAFRWWGRPCGPSGPGGASVSWWGSRRPDPSKDSVVILSETGEGAVRRVTRVTRARDCADAAALRVEWQPDVDRPGVVVRGFERGAYRLDDAFRYRRGSGGAQPLTAPVFSRDSVGISAGAEGAVVDLTWGRPRMWPWP